MSALPESVRADDLDRYLCALFGRARPSSLIELRWRVPTGMHRSFVVATELGRARRTIERFAGETDVYIGVLPRWRRAGGRSAIVGDCRTVWVDLDCDAAERILEPLDPPPALVIASGTPGHRHAYWTLRAAVAPGQIERANRRLAWAIGGDLGSIDAARILRPPGAINHRRETAPVTLEAEVAGPCRLAELIGGLADPPPKPRHFRDAAPRQPRQPRHGDRLLGIGPERYVALLTGHAIGRDRKVRCPLHDDHTPSLHAYAQPDQGWYCFGCRRGGSIYDLAGALWHVDPHGVGMRGLRERLSVMF